MRKVVFLVILLLLSGCKEQEKFALYEQTNAQEKQQQIKTMLEASKEIEAANIVIIYDEVFVALQVKPRYKWTKQKIERQWQKKLEEDLPNDQVHVSADFKMHWESTKLLKHNQQKAMEKLAELKKLAKEET